MTEEVLTKAINDSYDGMLHAQMLRDYAQTEWMRKIADSLYHAHWTGYYLLLEIRKQMKKERTEGE